VLAGFLVVFLVEPTNEFLEDRAHGVIVHAGVLDRAIIIENGLGAEVDFRVEELRDERPEESQTWRAWGFDYGI
jgi:hypothetical protein